MLGSRLAASPLREDPSTAPRTASSSRSRSAATRVRSPSALFGRELHRPGHADGAGDVGGSRAQTILLTTAMDHRRQPDRRPPVADPQRAHTLGSVELVRRQGEQIDIELADIHRDLADGLGGVAVQRARPARGRARPPRATGWMVPVSLLASIRETRTVSSRRAASSSSSRTRPRSSTPTRLISQPRRCSAANGSSTEACSVAWLMMCRPRSSSASAAPTSARLLASVAPAVNTTSLAADRREAVDGGPGALERRRRITAGPVIPGRRIGEGPGHEGQHGLDDPRIAGSRGVAVEIDQIMGHHGDHLTRAVPKPELR